MTMKWKEINEDHLSFLEDVLQLYNQSFSIDVRESQQLFRKSIQFGGNRSPNNYHLLIGLKEEKLVSFVSGHYLADANSGFIVYLATNPLERSRGIGAQTLLKLEELFMRDAILTGHDSLKAIILESEKQELVSTEEEKKDCAKRDCFYQKNGYRKFKEIPYVQPPLNGGEEYIPLHLFIKEIQKEHISIDEIKQMIFAMYKEKYYGVNEIHQYVLENGLMKMGLKANNGK